MEYTGIPIIILICYMIGEIFKVAFIKKQNLYKLIPILVSIAGGVLGILIFLTTPTMLVETTNIWSAMQIGIISGASATTTNQIVKQLFVKKEEDLNER